MALLVAARRAFGYLRLIVQSLLPSSEEQMDRAQEVVKA
jgi:hypothetical protein